MVLNSKEVYKYIIDPMKTAKCQQHGVDLTVARICTIARDKEFPGTGVYEEETVLALETPKEFIESNTGWFVPVGFYSIGFEQGVKIPGNCKANIIHRSSIARCGGQIYSGEYDPGFETEHMGAFLVVHSPFYIEKGVRIAQIVMQRVEEGAPLYSGQFQGGEDISHDI